MVAEHVVKGLDRASFAREICKEIQYPPLGHFGPSRARGLTIPETFCPGESLKGKVSKDSPSAPGAV